MHHPRANVFVKYGDANDKKNPILDTSLQSIYEIFAKFEYFLNFINDVKDKNINGNWQERAEEIIESLLRYNFISKIINPNMEQGKEEAKICKILKSYRDIRCEEIKKTEETENVNYHPIPYVQVGDALSEEGMIILPNDLTSTMCYKKAAFKFGEKYDYEGRIYLKNGDFKPMLNKWIPDDKIGKIEKYLRNELGYYPPWLEVQIRAIVHFNKTYSTEKIQINDVINWLKNDNELLKLIKLKKEDLTTSNKDLISLTKFLHHEITRQK